MSGLALPGGVGISHLRVYDTAAPDGVIGGTPHLHTACTEAYLVIAGEGLVQTLSADGYGETPLEVGTVAWFSPGTVHRLVNLDGRLEIFVLMANAGLPEAGDMVITFAPEVLADPDAYRAAATLPPGETTTDGSGEAARVRRDRGVEGFGWWKARVEADPVGGLAELHAAAASLVAPAAAGWGAIVDAGPGAAVAATHAALADLAEGRGPHLAAAAIARRDLAVDHRRMGCCGTLGVLVDP